MLLLVCRTRIAALYILFGISKANSITTPPASIPTTLSTETCEFGTINYITDVLPQQCLKSTWTGSSISLSTRLGESQDSGTITSALGATSAIAPTESIGPTEVVVDIDASRTSSTLLTDTTIVSEAPAPEHEQTELDDTSFLSFEEWRKKNEAKAEQDNPNGGNRRGKERRRESEGIQNHLDSLGDEGEFDLDFGAFKSDKNDRFDGTQSQGEDGKSDQSKESRDSNAEMNVNRGKDAGKTCKERANYASFDAGATVLKTHKGAKNAKAILIEHKDSYMLSECKIKNKFVIIELTEEVWIDTLVLANYEFFSSMIRSFQVSISERYPVKIDKWKIIGTYEARNSREIQAFLIENPQVWGRYLRIEFLTHYGNEYYCPLSLVRVHGARMLESLKEGEANNEEDEDVDDDDNDEVVAQVQTETGAPSDVPMDDKRLQAELQEAQAAIDHLVKEAQEITAALTDQSINVDGMGEVNVSLEHAIQEQMTTPWVPGFDFGVWMNISRGIDVCLPKEAPPQTLRKHLNDTRPTDGGTEDAQAIASSRSTATSTLDGITNLESNFTSSTTAPAAVTGTQITHSPTSSPISTSIMVPDVSGSTNKSLSSSSASIISSAAKLQNATMSIKSRMSTTSSAVIATPTQQESFFKAVSRRLQLLEANSTLSLQYIEAQSKALREAFSRVEKRQLNKTTTFLDTLNSTVLTELKDIRQQYDEIWQSTVISLESQRAESRKEILAITTRLNILADEIVFQKRMSIVQSVLLLLCLGLVIFSRVSPGLPTHFSNRSRYLNNYSIESPIISPPGSPDYHNEVEETPERVNGWSNGHARPQSNNSIYSEDNEDMIYEEGEEGVQEDSDSLVGDDDISKTPRSPPTPTSLYSSSSSVDITPPHREATSTPLIFDRMPQLRRAASSSYSLHLNHEKSLRAGSPSIPSHLSLKNSEHELSMVSRQRSKSDLNHVQQGRSAGLQTPPKRDGIVRHFFHRTNSEEKPLPGVKASPSSPLNGNEQSMVIDLGNTNQAIEESSLTAAQTLTPGRNFSLPANGQPSVLNTSSPSPLNLSRSESASSNGFGTHRHASHGSFGIARKPLPALPIETGNEEDEDETK